MRNLAPATSHSQKRASLISYKKKHTQKVKVCSRKAADETFAFSTLQRKVITKKDTLYQQFFAQDKVRDEYIELTRKSSNQ